jgi:hypothetical protein
LGMKKMDEAKAKSKEAAQELRVNEEKWSPLVMAAGWTAIPSILIEKQEALALDPLDINILLHLAMYWWKPDSRPCPSKATIASAVGVHPRTIQKRIAAMERDGFIHREERRLPGKGSKSNVYHLDGLIKILQPFAQEKIEGRAERKKQEEERIKRKRARPALKLVT